MREKEQKGGMEWGGYYNYMERAKNGKGAMVMIPLPIIHSASRRPGLLYFSEQLSGEQEAQAMGVGLDYG